MSQLNSKSKFDVLQKYLGGPAPTKKLKTETKPLPKTLNRIHDQELDAFNSSFQNGFDDDEDAPAIVDTEDIQIDTSLKAKLAKGEIETVRAPRGLQAKASGKWVSVDQTKPQASTTIAAKKPAHHDSGSESSGSSDDERGGRKRHDTSSEGGESSDEGDPEEDEDMKKMKKDMKNALGIKKEEQKKEEEEDDEDLNVVRKVGGLKTVAELKEESQLDKKKQDMLNQLAEQFKNKEVTYRGKDGKRIDLFKDMATRKEEKLKKNEEQISKWSSGLVQKQEKQNRKLQMQTVSEDFSKTGVSKEYDTELMEKRRFGDTMAPVIEKPKEKESTTTQRTGPRIKCKFTGVPNRFGIEPGRMWDGVDRGSEYERRFMAKVNERKDKEEMARTWAMQDM